MKSFSLLHDFLLSQAYPGAMGCELLNRTAAAEQEHRISRDFSNTLKTRVLRTRVFKVLLKVEIKAAQGLLFVGGV